MKTISVGSVAASLATIIALFLGASFSFVHAETDDDDARIVGTPRISESTALKIADKTYTGTGKFTDIELEMEDNVLVFAIEYTEHDGNEVDVKIDAKTGKVVLVESDKDELVDDDLGDEEDEEGSNEEANKQVLINLLTQLIALLKKQAQ